LERIPVAGQGLQGGVQAGVAGGAGIVAAHPGAGRRGVGIGLGPGALGDAAADLVGLQVAVHVLEGEIGAALLRAPGPAARGVGAQGRGVRVDGEGVGGDVADEEGLVVDLRHPVHAGDVDVVVVPHPVPVGGYGERTVVVLAAPDLGVAGIVSPVAAIHPPASQVVEFEGVGGLVADLVGLVVQLGHARGAGDPDHVVVVEAVVVG